MKVLIAGSSGFIGQVLIKSFQDKNHEVVKLVRSDPKDDLSKFQWSPSDGTLDKKALEGVDVVINLAGENILGLWTANKRAKINDSRQQGTKLLCSHMTEMKNPPSLLINASAIGIYGDCREKEITEESPVGSGFLAEVCKNWEEATQVAEEKGIRAVKLRIGLVLGNTGGPLTFMLTPFKLGLGGKLGNGRQYMSWVSINDIIGMIYHIIDDEKLIGPINAVAPNPVTNLEFTKTLGKVLRRPTFIPVPKFPANLVLGDLAKEVFFSGANVQPQKLLASNYNFQHSNLEMALRNLLGR